MFYVFTELLWFWVSVIFSDMVLIDESQIAFQIVLASARCQRRRNDVETTLARFGIPSGLEPIAFWCRQVSKLTVNDC